MSGNVVGILPIADQKVYTVTADLEGVAYSRVWVDGDGEFVYELLADGRGCFGIEVEYKRDWDNAVVTFLCKHGVNVPFVSLRC